MADHRARFRTLRDLHFPSVSRGLRPSWSRFTNALARELRQPEFDGVVIVPLANFGVIEVSTDRGLQRYLLAGTPLLFILNVDELRAIISHEIGHIALRHTRWGRALGRWIKMIEAVGTEQEHGLHPLSWSLRFSAWLLSAIRGPWSRGEELDADQFAARSCGREALVSALRKTHEIGNTLGLLLQLIAHRTRQTGIGPESWTEAAYRAFEEMAPMQRIELRRGLRGDPFDVDGRSHPPFAIRLGALASLPKGEFKDTRRVISAFADILLEEAALTREFLPAHHWVSARDWRESVDPSRVRADEMAAIEAATGFADINFGE